MITSFGGPTWRLPAFKKNIGKKKNSATLTLTAFKKNIVLHLPRPIHAPTEAYNKEVNKK